MDKLPSRDQASALSLMAQIKNLPNLGDLCIDSRQLKKGDVFISLSGKNFDGHHFIQDAIKKGVSAIIHESTLNDGALTAELNRRNIPHFKEPRLKDLLSDLATSFYGAPSEKLWIAAVTGTNGKTSVSHWLRDLINQAKSKAVCGIIGTLGSDLPPNENKTTSPLTTPDAISIQKTLHYFAKHNLSHCALEASSIGLATDRLRGTAIDVGIVTNLSHDHLDFHANMSAYRDAKMRLFSELCPPCWVLNLDDHFGHSIFTMQAKKTRLIYGYSQSGRKGGDVLVQAENIRHKSNGLSFDLVTPAGEFGIKTDLIGEFNVSNLLAAFCALHAAGFSWDLLPTLSQKLKTPPGRLDIIGRRPLTIVDFAHTPDALMQCLKSLRQLIKKKGRLICVFGCGGNRDTEKRSLMGKVAEEYADITWITTDNPRWEDPQAIINDIAKSLTSSNKQVDRQKAIENAIAESGKHDIVLIAGKGHENYQEIKGKRTLFSDFDIARAALKKHHLEASSS